MPTTATAVPNGVERFVGPDELFFSTTDAKGVIRSGNSVFARISHYSVAELVGTPHNVVRHPDMPAGAFRLVWDRLLAGRPAAAYVLNLAQDGAHYWVFATITPLGDGFLSVRMAPRSVLFEPAKALYTLVRQEELQRAERDRLPRAQVAAIGAASLEAM